MSINKDIEKALFDVVEAAGILEESFPNVSFDKEKPYLDLSILRSGVFSEGLNIDVHEGMLQVLVMDLQDVGEIKLLEIADQVIALFPRNTRIIEGNTIIYIERTGWVGTALPIDGGYSIPVTIPYKVLN